MHYIGSKQLFSSYVAYCFYITFSSETTSLFLKYFFSMTVHTHFHFFLLHLSRVSGILYLFRGFPCLDLAFCLAFWPCVLSCKWPYHKSYKSHCSTQHMFLWLSFSHAGQSSRLLPDSELQLCFAFP